MTTITIKTLVEAHVQAKNAKCEASRRKRYEFEQNIDQKRAERRNLLSKIEKLTKFIEDAKHLEACSEKQVTDRKHLTDSIAALDKEIESLTALRNSVPNADSPSTHRLETLCQAIECLSASYYGKPAIREVERPEDIFTCLPLPTERSIDYDAAGHPSRFTLMIGGNKAVEVPLRKTTRVVKDFRPEKLRWIPASALAAPNANASKVATAEQISPTSLLLIYVKSAESFFLSSTSVDYTEPKEWDKNTWNPQPKERKEDFNDIAFSMQSTFSQQLKNAGGELDLAEKYENNWFMDCLRKMVLDMTTEIVQFTPSSEQATSPELEKRLRPAWELLINAPWHEAIVGTMATLKYSLENGERARFWNDGFENYFGFRLRTRDHTWVTGEIYQSTVKGSEQRPVVIEILEWDRYGEAGLTTIRIGAMYLRARISK